MDVATCQDKTLSAIGRYLNGSMTHEELCYLLGIGAFGQFQAEIEFWPALLKGLKESYLPGE